MKKLFNLLMVFAFTIGVFSQAPQKMSYQAVIRNASNQLVANQQVGMKISILQGSASGTAVYEETQAPVTNANGLISVEIGSGTVVAGTFAGINWAAGPYFIKTETDPSGGAAYTISGTNQLMSVPYALFSASGTPGTQGPPGILISGSTAGNTPYWNGTNWIVNSSNIYNNGSNIGIGTSSPNTSAALDINSSNGTLLLPRMTTTQRDLLTPAEGMMIYNLTVKKFQGYGYGSTFGAAVVDQQNLLINNGGGEDRAQSFTPAISGNLSAIEIPLNTMSGTIDIKVSIRAGSGTAGAILHTQIFTIPGGGMIWYIFNITGVNVIAGNTYTIHVTEVNPGSCGIPPCYSWGMDTSGNNYPGGLFYYAGTPYSGGIYDCAFKTYVQPITATTLQWIDLH